MRSRDGEPQHRAVHDTWQYVSIIETLRSIFSRKDVFDVLNAEEPSGFISSFKDGLRFAKSDLLTDRRKATAALQLFYDDFEVKNCEIKDFEVKNDIFR